MPRARPIPTSRGCLKRVYPGEVSESASAASRTVLPGKMAKKRSGIGKSKPKATPTERSVPSTERDEPVGHLEGQTAASGTTGEITALLNLQDHFEGGYFRQTWRSNHTVDLAGSTRVASTSIYYVMARGQSLAWHKLRADNIHAWHSGGFLKVHILEPKVNGEYRIEYLGNTLENGDWNFQLVVPHEHWYALEVLGGSRYTLWGEIVTPGWEFEDFAYGTREELLRLYPDREELIDKFLLKTE